MTSNKPKAKKGKRESKLSKRGKIIIIISLIAGCSFLYVWFNVFGIGSGDNYGPMTVQVLDMGHNDNDVSESSKVWIYRVDISDMDLEDILALAFDDYVIKVEDEVASDVNYVLEEGYLYYMKVKYSGQVTWRTPVAGENIVLTVDQSEAISVIVYDEDHNQTILGNTNTEYTAEVVTDGDDEGYITSYLFDEDDFNLIWFDLNFTIAAEDDFAEIDGYYNKKHTSGTHLYIGVTGSIVDRGEYTLDFDSDKADTFDCNNIAIEFGIYSELF